MFPCVPGSPGRLVLWVLDKIICSQLWYAGQCSRLMKHICFCDRTEWIAPLWKWSSRVFQTPHNQNVSFFIHRFNLPHYPSFLSSIRPSCRCSPFPLLLVLHILFTRLKHKAPRHLIHPPLFSPQHKAQQFMGRVNAVNISETLYEVFVSFFLLLKVNTLYMPWQGRWGESTRTAWDSFQDLLRGSDMCFIFCSENQNKSSSSSPGLLFSFFSRPTSFSFSCGWVTVSAWMSVL